MRIVNKNNRQNKKHNNYLSRPNDEYVETLSALAEIQDEELEHALTNAIADDGGASMQVFNNALKDVTVQADKHASMQDSDTPSTKDEALINAIVKTENEDDISKQGHYQLDRDRREATEGFGNKLTETQNENDDTIMNAELEKIERDKSRDKEALEVLANVLAQAQQEEISHDQKERELENELASIDEDDGNIQNGELTKEEDNEARKASLSVTEGNARSQDTDEDIQAVLNEILTSNQAAAIQRDENPAKAISRLYLTANIQRRRRRRWRRPTRIIRRSIRRIIRVARKPIRKIVRIIRNVRCIRKLRKAIKKIQPKRLDPPDIKSDQEDSPQKSVRRFIKIV